MPTGVSLVIEDLWNTYHFCQQRENHKHHLFMGASRNRGKMMFMSVTCALGFATNISDMGVLTTNMRKSKVSLISMLLLSLMLSNVLLLALALPFKACWGLLIIFFKGRGVRDRSVQGGEAGGLVVRTFTLLSGSHGFESRDC